ncbi:hypothetical protein J1614_011245 [Plenodomus biglobosus]|nr:hypothetical protein J1614_011245 [Plenodomus biglobosus]
MRIGYDLHDLDDFSKCGRTFFDFFGLPATQTVCNVVTACAPRNATRKNSHHVSARTRRDAPEHYSKLVWSLHWWCVLDASPISVTTYYVQYVTRSR